jgi:cytochrome c oxidase cbb3-type subunit IV
MIEISIVRGILTLLLMLVFITLFVWLYAKKHAHAFDEAARLPLEDLEDSAVDHVVSSKTPGKAGKQS